MLGDLDGLGCDGLGCDGLGDLGDLGGLGDLVSPALLLLGGRHLRLAGVLDADVLVDTPSGKQLPTVRANEISDGPLLLTLVS